MVYQIPNIELKFRMPRSDNDANLLAAARAFYAASDQYEAEMFAYGLPTTFRDELNDAIEVFEQSLNAPGAAIDSQVEATADMGETVRRGMQAVRILDGVVRNKYRGNTGKLAAWLSASYIEKLSAREKLPAE